jgi:hypothetical protein
VHLLLYPIVYLAQPHLLFIFADPTCHALVYYFRVHLWGARRLDRTKISPRIHPMESSPGAAPIGSPILQSPQTRRRRHARHHARRPIGGRGCRRGVGQRSAAVPGPGSLGREEDGRDATGRRRGCANGGSAPERGEYARGRRGDTSRKGAPGAGAEQRRGGLREHGQEQSSRRGSGAAGTARGP